MKLLALPIRIAKVHAKLARNPNNLRLKNHLKTLKQQQQINEQFTTT